MFLRKMRSLNHFKQETHNQICILGKSYLPHFGEQINPKKKKGLRRLAKAVRRLLGSRGEKSKDTTYSNTAIWKEVEIKPHVCLFCLI